MDFQQKIKDWVSNDNQIKKLQKQTKDLKEIRNELSDEIFSYVDENNLRNTVIEISDGRLKFNQVKTNSPITLKYLKQCLLDKLEDEEKVDDIIEYIKENREIKYNDIVKRYTSN